MKEQEPQNRSDQRADFERLSQELVDPKKLNEPISEPEKEVIPKQG